MKEIFILLAIATATTVLSLGLTRRRPLFSRHTGAWLVLFATLGLLSAAIIQQEQRRLAAALGQHRWPVAEGKIVAAEISHTRVLNPMITYEYNVDGRKYRQVTDLNTPMFGGRNKRFETSEHVLAYYRPGKIVQVHFDPAHPERSTLRPGPAWDLLMKTGMGYFLFVGAIFFLANLLTSSRKISA